MMDGDGFVPYHINAEKGDFDGTEAVGAISCCPVHRGGRKKIASMWKDVAVKKHPRATICTLAGWSRARRHRYGCYIYGDGCAQCRYNHK